MKKIAIFGFGNHVKKNILPAISRSNNLDISYIVRRNINDSAKEEYKNIKFITLDESFEKINHKNTNLVYIANPTSEHYIWSKESIFNKYDVLCEKPLTNSHEDTKHLIKLAQENSVNINEVCIYKFHKQYLYLKELVESSKKVFDAVLSEKFKVEIFKKYSLNDAKKAHEELEARLLTGPAVIIPN